MTEQPEMTENEIRGKIRSYIPDVLERLGKLSQSKNESTALNACRLILDKAVSNIKPTKSSDQYPW